MMSVLVMAGGTGGHVFPALAVARLLRERNCRITWVGTQRGLESRVVPADGFPIEWLSVSGLRGKGVATLLLAPFQLARALWQAMGIVRRNKPAVVLGVGGFVTGPGGLAARLLGKPLVIHEQNAISGLTNRLLARMAWRVLEAFPGSFPRGVHAQSVGNPVRREIEAIPSPERRFAERRGPIRLLIVGGSLGALRLNTSVPRALRALEPTVAFDVWHQTGERAHAQTMQDYGDYGAGRTAPRVTPFIEDMAEAYAWADLIICRAGALTVSELAAAGLGAILVPYPSAVDDHQTHNARYLTDAGAAVLIADRDLEPQRLADELSRLCADRMRLLDMARLARTRAVPEAAEKLAQAVLEAAGVCA